MLFRANCYIIAKIYGEENSGEGEGGGEGGDTPTPGDDATFCHFTGNTPSSSQVVLAAGSYSNSKGTVTYGGKTYSNCVKMESSTKIEVTPTNSGNVTLIFGGSTAAGSKKVKVNNTQVTTDSNGKYIFTATAGQKYTIEKGDAINLFIIELPASSTSVVSVTANNVNELKAVKYAKNGGLYLERNGKQYNAAGAQTK